MKVYDFSETLKMSRVNSAEDPAVPKTFQLVDSVQLPLSLRTGRENVRFSQIVPQFNVIVLSTDVQCYVMDVFESGRCFCLSCDSPVIGCCALEHHLLICHRNCVSVIRCTQSNQQ